MHPDTRGLISVDDHLLEPTNLFSDFGGSHYQGTLPRWGLNAHTGAPGWFCGNTHYPISKAAIAAGQPWGQAGIFVPAMDVPEHFSDPAERLKAMDTDGIAVSLCYSSFMGLGGETMVKHPELDDPTQGEPGTRMAAISAYNTWLDAVWCAQAPDRFIPCGILPLWDQAECGPWAVYLATRGFKAVAFPQAPDQIGLPPLWDRSWSPLYRALEETGLVLCQHTLSDDMQRYTTAQLPPYLPLTLARTSGIETIASWLLTPILDNHPRLKIMVAEAGVAWIPWFLSLADQSARLHKAEFGKMGMLPSERFEKHFGVSILGSETFPADVLFSLPAGCMNRLFWESDYPHLDGSFPYSRAGFVGLDIPDQLRSRVARDNAVAFFGLTDPYQFPA